MHNIKQNFYSMRKPLIYICIGISLLGCNNESSLKIDVANVVIPELTIDRMEEDVFKMDTAHADATVEQLGKKYGKFFNSYLVGVLNNGGMPDSSNGNMLKRFVSDRDMRQAYLDCKKAYPDVEFLKKDFTDCFKHFKHYFPKRFIPKVVTMMSGFNYSVVTLDSTIGVGLDMYLGTKNEFYDALGLPLYKKRYMNRDDIMPDAVRGWLLNEFPYTMNKQDFLSQIVYMGKIMYASDALMPETPDTLKSQFTNLQMQYCVQNEFNVWSYFIAQKLLYTTDQAEIMKFTKDGPFTTAFSKQAPPRIGYWVGYQIVKKYMKTNPSVTLNQLMDEQDAQNILAKAKYKPGK